MNRVRKKRIRQNAFTLPTVLVTSVIMLGLLALALQLATAANSALKEQYYGQLAREAAESGLSYALMCLRNNGMISPWQTRSLKPETDCSGNVVAGQHTNVLTAAQFRTRFVVPPLVTSGGEYQQAYATGYVDMVRPNGTVWKTYSKVLSLATGAQTRVDTLAFGYESGAARHQYNVFFAVVDSAGKVRSVGANNNGQLGSGMISPGEAVPVRFTIPKRVVSVHANFVSVGGNLIVRDEDGNVYGSGRNDTGVLGGGGAYNAAEPTPIRFLLPSGVKGVAVNPGWANFVLGDNHKIYAAGECSMGLLGTGDYSVPATQPDNCTDRSTPKQVALPAPNPANPATIPTSHMVQDRYNAYVIMHDGSVYGWGANDYYQLARVGVSSTSTPVKIGEFGNPGKPRALQLAFDGATLYVLANNGKVYATGSSVFSQPGDKDMVIKSRFFNEKCLENRGSWHTTVSLLDCNDTSRQLFEFSPNEEIKIGGRCLENTAGDGVNLRLASCNGSTIQRWNRLPHASDIILLQRSGSYKCIQADSTSPTLKLANCDYNNQGQSFKAQTHRLIELAIPGFVQQVSTDEMFASYRTSDGRVFSTGGNKHGAFGNSANNKEWRNPRPVQFALPSGVRAVDMWSTSFAGRVSNLFVVGDDGKVYGAGSNRHGQLGTGDTTDRIHATPMLLFGATPSSPRAEHVESGGGTTVIFTSDRKVYTVGNNDRGQLGDGTTTDAMVPILGRYTNVPIHEYLTF